MTYPNEPSIEPPEPRMTRARQAMADDPDVDALAEAATEEQLYRIAYEFASCGSEILDFDEPSEELDRLLSAEFPRSWPAARDRELVKLYDAGRISI